MSVFMSSKKKPPDGAAFRALADESAGYGLRLKNVS